MKILSLSDVQLGMIYSNQVCNRFTDIELVIGCGDLPYYYLEYIISKLDVSLYYVRGNHAPKAEYTQTGARTAPLGGVDLHRRVVCHDGVLLAGVEGSLRYSRGPFQYSQAEMWQHVFSLVPSLLINRGIYGRYLDVFVSHAPPKGIHDRPDLTHRGISAFYWLLKVFKPDFHLHGHIHVYRPDEATETKFRNTQVVNSFGFKVVDVKLNANHPPRLRSWRRNCK